MIHSNHSEFSSSASKAFHASPTHRSARGTLVTDDSAGISTAVWPVLGFGHQPETNSLWDTGLLDRLSLPLTRYHE
jgi:hypothetical protein